MHPPRLAFALLLLATFAVALGYGVLLPVLPTLVVRLMPGASQTEIVWHTGLATAAYAGASLLVAPIAGRLSDRSPTSLLIVLSLLLSGAATVAAGYASNLTNLYMWRLAAGAGAGVFAPATQAWLGRWAPDDGMWRTRRVVWAGLASTAGLFVGPFAGGLLAAAGAKYGGAPELAQQMPLLTVGYALLGAAAVIAAVVKKAPADEQRDAGASGLIGRISHLLIPVAATALAVSSFEVTLAFMGKDQRMSPFEIGLLFAQCTLVMFVAQTILVTTRLRDRPLIPLILPATAILAAGLLAMIFASGFVWHTVSTGMIAIGGGLLPPVLAREISVLDGGSTGSANGIQSAAGQAGQTLGAILASAVTVVAAPRWTFAAAAFLVIVAAFLQTRGARRLKLHGSAA